MGLLIIWWFEAENNYFYDILVGIKKVCPWIDVQTKFKLRVCKVFWLSLVISVIIIVWNALYSPYLANYFSVNNGEVQLREDIQESDSPVDINQNGSEALKIEIVNQDSQIGDWGTFGDFIGGTLNPIIGFISILLLFATWRLTRKTLNFTKEELNNSNQLLRIQQFDAIFWGLLEHLKKIEDSLYEKNSDHILIIDEVYSKIFCYSLDESLYKKRQKILSNAQISQYFILLYQIFKNIDEKISKDDFKLKKSYSNILRANVSTKILQILVINCYENFPEYKTYLEKFGFLEHMPFSFVTNERLINLKLLECLSFYDKQAFDKSIYFKDYLNDEALKLFFEGKPKKINEYLNLLLGGVPKTNEIELKIDLDHEQIRKFDLIIEIGQDNGVTIYPKNKQNIYGTMMEDIILRSDPQKVSLNITKRGFELKIYNLWVVINSLKSMPIRIEKNPL
ncbi:putative phage abortive infection protein [Acinetobacter sp. WCHAc010034]|uniref:putative phage abortive infection protein n=1 Tax=Acinetobacter sp. WCHAc010034 TaxID=1879049 RepID=UPI0013C3646E|nr:putative phage abortive infection protein [Acinetobacter sp. WCHAc010034]